MIWQMIAAMSAMNLIIRYKTWPKGPYSLAVYDNTNENDNKSWLYDAKTIEDLEKQVLKDFGHLITPNRLPILKTLGMPQPPMGIPQPC